MNDLEWDEATPNGVNYKSLDTRFLAELAGDTWCPATHATAWSDTYGCWRNAGHTGRHLALEHRCRYPVAVWK